MVFYMPRDVCRNTGTRVAYDHDVAAHRFQRIDSVEDALAFLARRGVHIEIEHICTQALAREIERGASARARFKKQVGYGPPGE